VAPGHVGSISVTDDLGPGRPSDIGNVGEVDRLSRQTAEPSDAEGADEKGNCRPGAVHQPPERRATFAAGSDDPGQVTPAVWRQVRREIGVYRECFRLAQPREEALPQGDCGDPELSLFLSQESDPPLDGVPATTETIEPDLTSLLGLLSRARRPSAVPLLDLWCRDGGQSELGQVDPM